MRNIRGGWLCCVTALAFWRGAIGQRRCHDGCRQLAGFGSLADSERTHFHLMKVLPRQAAVPRRPPRQTLNFERGLAGLDLEFAPLLFFGQRIAAPRGSNDCGPLHLGGSSPAGLRLSCAHAALVSRPVDLPQRQSEISLPGERDANITQCAVLLLHNADLAAGGKLDAARGQTFQVFID